jgi:hypothetical protein
VADGARSLARSGQRTSRRVLVGLLTRPLSELTRT